MAALLIATVLLSTKYLDHYLLAFLTTARIFALLLESFAIGSFHGPSKIWDILSLRPGSASMNTTSSRNRGGLRHWRNRRFIKFTTDFRAVIANRIYTERVPYPGEWVINHLSQPDHQIPDGSLAHSVYNDPRTITMICNWLD